MPRRTRFSCLSAAALASLLAACSSGGGSSAPPVVAAPPPPPPPTAPPTPAPGAYDTPEFRRQAALSRVNIGPAYDAGRFGAGQLIAVIDGGIEVNSPEYAGRIDSRSADLAIAGVVSTENVRPGGPSLQDVDGHGNAVASIIGAAKNDIGMHGVAPAATLLIFRTDKPGDPNTYLGSAILEGVRRAAAARADVVNFSLGSTDAGARADFDQIFAITSAADIVAVAAAGNDGAAEPDFSAQAAVDAGAAGAAIIAGAVTATNERASFSNAAGAYANFYLVAPGTGLSALAINGGAASLRSFSGTSASTPVISGAAALLREAWPQLTAAQTVDILLTTATDLGAPGPDPIFGRGLLNIGRAIQPAGATSTASASGAPLPVDGGVFIASEAFGANAVSLGRYAFLDAYGRDFHREFSAVAVAPLAADASALLGVDQEWRSAMRPLAGGAAVMRLGSFDARRADAAAGLRAPLFSEGPDQRERLDFAYLASPTPALSIAFSQGFAAREIDALLGGADDRSLSRGGLVDPYLDRNARAVGAATKIAVSDSLSLRFTAVSSHADEADGDFYFDAPPGARASAFKAGAERQFGSLSLGVEAGVRIENGGPLGAAFGGVLGAPGRSATFYQALSGAAPVGGWRVRARASFGATTVTRPAAGFIEGFSTLRSTHFAVSAERGGVFARGDIVSFGVVQPLRIEAGAMQLLVPERYDLDTRALVFAQRPIALDAGAREIDVEARYSTPIAGANVEIAAIRQFNALDEGRAATTAIARVRRGF